MFSVTYTELTVLNTDFSSSMTSGIFDKFLSEPNFLGEFLSKCWSKGLVSRYLVGVREASKLEYVSLLNCDKLNELLYFVNYFVMGISRYSWTLSMNSFDSSLILELISFLLIEIKLQVESNFLTIL